MAEDAELKPVEWVGSSDRNVYRTVYTVRFQSAIYVLHAFQKKSKKGTATPKQDIELVEKRLKTAAEHYKENYEQEDKDRKS